MPCKRFVLLGLMLGSVLPRDASALRHHDRVLASNDQWWGFGTPEENGLPGTVAGFTEFQGKLVAYGGFFQPAGMHCIGAWDGSAWQQLGAGVYMRHPAEPCNDDCIPAINAAVIFRDELVVGGLFRFAGGYFARHRADNIARWDGSSWAAFDAGLQGQVNRLVIYEGDLVAIEVIDVPDSFSTGRFMRFSSGAWHEMNSGFAGFPNDLVATSTGLFASSDRLYRWSGLQWQPVSEVEIADRSLGVYRDSIVATAKIVENNITRHRVAMWSRNQWVTLGEGLESEIGRAGCFLEVDAHLFAGGSLPHHGNIAEWNGAKWDTLGSGVGPGLSPHVSYDVTALYRFGHGLFVGGDFIAAGHKPSYRIARWDLVRIPVGVEGPVAVTNGDQVVLSWNFSSSLRDQLLEVDVLRSAPGEAFEIITPIPLVPASEMEWHDQVPSGVWWYRLSLRDIRGNTTMTEAISVVVEGSRSLVLRQPHESPGGDGVRIRYSLGAQFRDATLSIIAPTGRVIIYYQVSGGPGEHALLWNRRDWRGMQVARGVYFVQLSSNQSTVNRKFVLMRR